MLVNSLFSEQCAIDIKIELRLIQNLMHMDIYSSWDMRYTFYKLFCDFNILFFIVACNFYIDWCWQTKIENLVYHISRLEIKKKIGEM